MRRLEGVPGFRGTLVFWPDMGTEGLEGTLRGDLGTNRAASGAEMHARTLEGWWAIGHAPLSGRFQVSDVTSPLNGLREDALLAHALHCRRFAAYLLIARMRRAKCSGKGGELGSP